jgi:hypothetical protein
MILQKTKDGWMNEERERGIIGFVKNMMKQMGNLKVEKRNCISARRKYLTPHSAIDALSKLFQDR